MGRAQGSGGCRGALLYVVGGPKLPSSRRHRGSGHQTSHVQKSTEHAKCELGPTNSLTKVLTSIHTGLYTKMSMEMTTKSPHVPHEESSHEESRERARQV